MDPRGANPNCWHDDSPPPAAVAPHHHAVMSDDGVVDQPHHRVAAVVDETPAERERRELGEDLQLMTELHDLVQQACPNAPPQVIATCVVGAAMMRNQREIMYKQEQSHAARHKETVLLQQEAVELQHEVVELQQEAVGLQQEAVDLQQEAVELQEDANRVMRENPKWRSDVNTLFNTNLRTAFYNTCVWVIIQTIILPKKAFRDAYNYPLLTLIDIVTGCHSATPNENSQNDSSAPPKEEKPPLFTETPPPQTSWYTFRFSMQALPGQILATMWQWLCAQFSALNNTADSCHSNAFLEGIWRFLVGLGVLGAVWYVPFIRTWVRPCVSLLVVILIVFQIVRHFIDWNDFWPILINAGVWFGVRFVAAVYLNYRPYNKYRKETPTTDETERLKANYAWFPTVVRISAIIIFVLSYFCSNYEE
jgi:FtsZ-binding cell division protein ZapB